MQNKETKKTELAPKKQSGPLIYIIISFTLLIALMGGFIFIKNRIETVTHRQVVINNQVFNLELASTQADREKGLSERDNIATNGGMLFDFGGEGDWRMWMVQMRFPIDIIWTKEDGTVVYIKKNAKPADFPEIYKSPEQARYVIELQSGTAETIGLKEGSVVTIK